VRLPDLINKTASTFAPSVVGDGSLYFMQSNEETGRFRIYRAQWKNGNFEAPVPAGFSNGDWSDVDPLWPRTNRMRCSPRAIPHTRGGKGRYGLIYYVSLRQSME